MKRIIDSLLSAQNFTKDSLLKIKSIFSAEGNNTREILNTYGRYLSGDSSKEEMEAANDKFRDLLKAIGLGSLCVIPGSVITVPAILYAAKKLGIDLLPKSFYEQFPNLKKHNDSPKD